MADLKKAVEEKFKADEASGLHRRMDEDKDLDLGKLYNMVDSNKQDVPGIFEVTTNKPETFLADVLSSLGATVRQTIVVSADETVNTSEIERFQEAAFNAANDRLRRQGRPLLDPFFDEQFSVRGRGGARCLFRMKNGVLVPDIIPIDTRFSAYESDDDEIAMAGYKTIKSKAMVERQYPKYRGSVSSAGIECLDLWDKKINEVWLDNTKVHEEANKDGYVPFVFRTVSLGSMLQDADALSHWGESIFFLIRHLIPEYNRLLSIMQTINMQAPLGALQYPNKGGKGATPPDYPETGTVTSLDENEKIFPIDVRDIQRSAVTLLEKIDLLIQEGSKSSVNLGSLNFPLAGVTLLEIEEGQEQVFLPRLDAKSWLNQGLVEMFTRQVIRIGKPVELGRPGHKQKFDLSVLQGQYETTYKYRRKSPKTDIGRITMANQAREWYPPGYIYEKVLEVEDPAGIQEEMALEVMMELSPVVRDYVLLARITEDEVDMDEVAKLYGAQMEVDVDALMRGEISPTTTRERPTPEDTGVTLFGRGAGTQSSAKKAAQPREE